jgi:hypothetical protein
MREVWNVCTVSLGRRRLPGETLVNLEGGLRLAVEVPAKYRLEPILPSGRASGGLDRREMPR